MSKHVADLSTTDIIRFDHILADAVMRHPAHENNGLGPNADAKDEKQRYLAFHPVTVTTSERIQYNQSVYGGWDSDLDGVPTGSAPIVCSCRGKGRGGYLTPLIRLNLDELVETIFQVPDSIASYETKSAIVQQVELIDFEDDFVDKNEQEDVGTDKSKDVKSTTKASNPDDILADWEPTAESPLESDESDGDVHMLSSPPKLASLTPTTNNGAPPREFIEEPPYDMTDVGSRRSERVFAMLVCSRAWQHFRDQKVILPGLGDDAPSELKNGMLSTWLPTLFRRNREEKGMVQLRPTGDDERAAATAMPPRVIVHLEPFLDDGTQHNVRLPMIAGQTESSLQIGPFDRILGAPRDIKCLQRYCPGRHMHTICQLYGMNADLTRGSGKDGAMVTAWIGVCSSCHKTTLRMWEWDESRGEHHDEEYEERDQWAVAEAKPDPGKEGAVEGKSQAVEEDEDVEMAGQAVSSPSETDHVVEETSTQPLPDNSTATLIDESEPDDSDEEYTVQDIS
ncbi:hypothetical protein J8273_6605 [Carpediemonas membranifera]|uniref:Uncharacterized protein n=1 Tax=Carpediemonas membranifera TaxID=201153 RepID=A0A8J6B132_9EUKA|nr:hypothetical protein J8273_6605 [Carpediemonas membranifera]|eukprot:KAG9392014.1 hypothetical protein J8273_6605 [Carpediemonas membranifera]